MIIMFGNYNNYYSYNYDNNYRQSISLIKDYGPLAFATNMNGITKINDKYRNTFWTGDHLQITLMSIPVGEDIGLEIHPNVDQFLYIEQGNGLVQMGPSKEKITVQEIATNNFGIMVPNNTWHNITNIGNVPLKLFSIYAPPQHEKGTVNNTKEDSKK